MPVISIEMHHADEQQKLELIRKLTATAVEVTNIPAQSFVVIINELPMENLGLGGKSLKEIRAAK